MIYLVDIFLQELIEVHDDSGPVKDVIDPPLRTGHDCGNIIIKIDFPRKSRRRQGDNYEGMSL